jgi:CheY-like chemotaxis protein
MFNQFSYLYVEDDPLSREIMRTALEMMMGVQTLTIFEDSADFMRRLNALPYKPDFILLDIHLEPCSGIELLRLIHASNQYKGSKIIALTASVMNEEMQRLKAAGFDGAIAKPMDVEVFPHVLRRIIAGEEVWHIA